MQSIRFLCLRVVNRHHKSLDSRYVRTLIHSNFGRTHSFSSSRRLRVRQLKQWHNSSLAFCNRFSFVWRKLFSKNSQVTCKTLDANRKREKSCKQIGAKWTQIALHEDLNCRVAVSVLIARASERNEPRISGLRIISPICLLRLAERYANSERLQR